MSATALTNADVLEALALPETVEDAENEAEEAYITLVKGLSDEELAEIPEHIGDNEAVSIEMESDGVTTRITLDPTEGDENQMGTTFLHSEI